MIKIGDKVRIDESKIMFKTFLDWDIKYTFTIINLYDNIALLDKKVSNSNISSNSINVCYLKTLKSERKEKLLKLNL